MQPCYIVKNVSKNVITLSDLHVEIRPNEEIDLEKTASRIAVEHSVDLKHAFRIKVLKIVKHIRPEKRIKVERLPSEKEMLVLIEKATAEFLRRSAEGKEKKPFDVSKFKGLIENQISNSIQAQFDGKFDMLLKAIQSLPKDSIAATVKKGSGDSPEVDIRELARITQKEINSLSDEMKKEEEPKIKAKKIKLDTKAINLAKELD